MLSLISGGAIGLCFLLAGWAIYASRRANTQSDNAVDSLKDKHDTELAHKELEGEHDKALLIIAGLEREVEGLRRALKVSEDEFHALASHSVEKIDSPEAASLLRLALERWERMRTEVPAGPASTATEGGGSSASVHVSTTEPPAES